MNFDRTLPKYGATEKRTNLSKTSRLAQLVERVTSNDEVSRSSRLMGTFLILKSLHGFFFATK